MTQKKSDPSGGQRKLTAVAAKSPKPVKVRKISNDDMEHFKRQFGILTPFT